MLDTAQCSRILLIGLISQLFFARVDRKSYNIKCTARLIDLRSDLPQLVRKSPPFIPSKLKKAPYSFWKWRSMLNKPIHRFLILTEKREKNISSTKKTAWTMNWTQDSLRPSVDFSAWNSKNFSLICDSLLSWTTFPSVHSSLYFSKIWYTLKHKKIFFQPCLDLPEHWKNWSN